MENTLCPIQETMRSFIVSKKYFLVHTSFDNLKPGCIGNCFGYACIFTGDIAAGCKLLRNRFESKDREWASYTCVLGFHVMGEKLNTLFLSWLLLPLNMMLITAGFQVCGWKAQTVLTSMPCAVRIVRDW